MQDSIKIKCLKGKTILPYIDNLAQLRITVFKEYPYLYSGDLSYEKSYLQTYANCSESILVLVWDKDNIVGASTAIPLRFETQECQKPFVEQGYKLEDIFYFGESVLLKPYRNKGVYKNFFKERELAAKHYGSKLVAFCGVVREQDDPRKPKDFQPLDPIWHHFGYKKHPTLCAYYEWQEIGSDKQTSKPMAFWTKAL
ncbi:MAG: GNAT family N-acetyltransferase [Proteobacteria bacterium]|nr:GNAT family N-acetyltransferase [Pseudomonadota bacterium]